MTLEERLAIIEQKAKNDKEKVIRKEKEIQDKTKEALGKLVSLESRISALIMIANKCIKENVNFPSSETVSKFGYGKGYNSYGFIADGFYHHVGFIRPRKSGTEEIEYLGIIGGGACGAYDFYTNGIETFLKHENTGEYKCAQLKHLNNFLNEFDLFEKSFYKWIDSLAE